MVMLPSMAGRAKCDQVVQYIVAELASLRLMMHLQVFRRAAILATPTVSVKDLEFQLSIRFGTELGSEPLWKDFDHEAC